jgi:hypothetical protein
LVDYITVLITDFAPSFLEDNLLLDFSMWQNVTEHGEPIPARNKKGEIKFDKKGGIVHKTPYKCATYKDLCFTIFNNGVITMSGSLHKYYNNGLHNFNDFGFGAFLIVLSDIRLKFGINPRNCILRCLEIGVNVCPPLPANEILNHSFLHKTTLFEDKYNSNEGRYKQAMHSQYIIKMYNKALHYRAKGFDISDEILRFEIKFTKMEKVNRLGIYNLDDLARLGLEIFGNDLVREFNNVLFYDPTITSRHKNLSKYRNPLFWSEVLKTRSRKTFYQHKTTLKNIAAESSYGIQANVSTLIREKVSALNSEGIQIDR